MLKRLLLAILTISISLHALDLNYIDKKYENFETLYFEDKNSSYTIDTLQDVSFNPILNTHSFSGKTGIVWYKLKLHNLTKFKKTVVLHNDFAYYSKEISIYIYAHQKLIKQNSFNILKESPFNDLTGSTLLYDVTIEPESTITVYIKNEPMVSNLFSLNIYTQKASQEALIKGTFYSIIIIAIMFTLAFYNATLYLFNRRKEFLLYALYLITPALGLMYKYGVIFSHFSLYGESSYWFNLTAIFMPGFLILFIKQLLNTKIMAKKINHVLNGILLIISLNILSAFLIDLTFAMEVFKVMFLLTTAALVYLTIYLFKVSHPLAIIFSFAYASYVIGLIITILGMSGITQLNFFTFHAGGFGIIVEALIFSYLMHYNVKLLEKKINDQREIIISKNKKAQLGDMISAITHQWKQPLNRIASVTTLLEFKLQRNVKIETKELKEKIQLINYNIHFLSETIEDFKDFFNPQGTAKEHDIAEIIQSAIKINSDSAVLQHIEINTDLKFEKNIITYKNELLHIILNILQNSREAFKKNDKDLKIIKIFGYNKDGQTYIDIIDNAGGINEEYLPFIFNENYTNKDEKSGSGLGLYLSKVILEGHLKGTIEASNTQDGAQFRIIL